MKAVQVSQYIFIMTLSPPQIVIINIILYKNQELLAGFVGYTNSEDTRFIENSLAIYSGFIFSDRSNKKINKKKNRKN